MFTERNAGSAGRAKRESSAWKEEGGSVAGSARQAGATIDGAAAVPRHAITKQDLYALGLSGGSNSAERRKKLLRCLDLPEHLSANAMLDALNLLVGRAELKVCCETLFDRQEDGDPLTRKREKY